MKNLTSFEGEGRTSPEAGWGGAGKREGGIGASIHEFYFQLILVSI